MKGELSEEQAENLLCEFEEVHWEYVFKGGATEIICERYKKGRKKILKALMTRNKPSD